MGLLQRDACFPEKVCNWTSIHEETEAHHDDGGPVQLKAQHSVSRSAKHCKTKWLAGFHKIHVVLYIVPTVFLICI